jgi:hypothetical protein
MDSKEIIMAPSSSDGGLLGGGGIGALLIGALLFGGGLGGFGGLGRGAAVAGVDPAIIGLQTQVQSLQNTVDTNEVSGAIGNLSTAQTAGFGQVSTQAQASNLTTLTNLNQLGRDIQTAANQTNLVNLNSFNTAAIGNLQSFNTLQQQLAANGANITSQYAQLQASMAECCCSIKGAVHAEGEETRELINSIQMQNIQAQLADAKSQVMALSQTAALTANNAAQTNVILQHLHTTGVVV